MTTSETRVQLVDGMGLLAKTISRKRPRTKTLLLTVKYAIDTDFLENGTHSNHSLAKCLYLWKVIGLKVMYCSVCFSCKTRTKKDHFELTVLKNLC